MRVVKLISLQTILAVLVLWFTVANLTVADNNTLQHTNSAACKQCHEEIYNQWQGSMHAQSSALRDPIHGAFYVQMAGDATKEGMKIEGKFPVCLKCHAPVAALDKTTKLDANEAYAGGISCVSCHTLTEFKGIKDPKGKPRYGVDAYKIDQNSMHGPKGNTYTTERVPDNATWPTPIHHPIPLQGNAVKLFQSNDICMGCHEKRSNSRGTPVCVTGEEYKQSQSVVNCQSCHMGIVTVPKLNNGQVVSGEFINIADHGMGGGHNARMVARGVALELETVNTDTNIKATVTLRNRLPHAYPTAAPFRSVIVQVAAYDAAGKELWKNYAVHPIKDDPKSALWYAMGDDNNKQAPPHLATKVLADTRLKPNEVRTLAYDIPRTPATAIVRVEVLYDLLLPPYKAMVKGKIPDALLKSQVVASAEVRL